MKTDIHLKSMIGAIVQLRAYDDNISVSIRLKMIEELNTQMRNIWVNKDECYKEFK